MKVKFSLPLCFLLGVDRSEFIVSYSWLKEDERSVGNGNKDDNSDDSKHLTDDYYAYYTKYFVYFNSLVITVAL